jgi:hypothetical protein
MLRTLHIHEDLHMKVDMQMHVKPGKGIMFYFQMRMCYFYLCTFTERPACV